MHELFVNYYGFKFLCLYVMSFLYDILKRRRQRHEREEGILLHRELDKIRPDSLLSCRSYGRCMAII